MPRGGSAILPSLVTRRAVIVAFVGGAVVAAGGRVVALHEQSCRRHTKSPRREGNSDFISRQVAKKRATTGLSSRLICYS